MTYPHVSILASQTLHAQTTLAMHPRLVPSAYMQPALYLLTYRPVFLVLPWIYGSLFLGLPPPNHNRYWITSHSLRCGRER